MARFIEEYKNNLGNNRAAEGPNKAEGAENLERANKNRMSDEAAAPDRQEKKKLSPSSQRAAAAAAAGPDAGIDVTVGGNKGIGRGSDLGGDSHKNFMDGARAAKKGLRPAQEHIEAFVEDISMLFASNSKSSVTISMSDAVICKSSTSTLIFEELNIN